MSALVQVVFGICWVVGCLIGLSGLGMWAGAQTAFQETTAAVVILIAAVVFLGSLIGALIGSIYDRLGLFVARLDRQDAAEKREARLAEALARREMEISRLRNGEDWRGQQAPQAPPICVPPPLAATKMDMRTATRPGDRPIDDEVARMMGQR